MLSLFLVDLKAATSDSFNGLVAVGLAACTEPALHLAGKASMRLLSQVVQIKFVDQPTRNAHHLAASRIGVVAVRRANDADAAMLKTLDHAFRFAEFTAEAIQAFQNQHIEAAGQRIGQKCLATGTQRHGSAATDPFIGMGCDDLPALTRGSRASFPQLVLD